MLALLALFSQTLVALLPMPAAAAAPDGMVLCGMADSHASSPTKAPPQHPQPACLACQAGHLAATLAPPPPIAFAAVTPARGWHGLPAAAAPPTSLSLGPQQARAPPLV